MKKSMLALLLGLWCVPLCAQEIRLDSLWVRMGGYPVTTFTPDSKLILLGQEDGIVNVVNTENGLTRDTIRLPKNGYADFQFTPDGKLLVVSEKNRIKLLKPYTWDSVGEIKNVNTIGFIAFGNNGRYIAISDWYETISIIDLENRKPLKFIKRPWHYQGSHNETLSYFNGKVSFSEDGTKLYGKYEEQFGYWDLTAENTPFKSLFTIGNRAIIGFTPDKKYMVQQANYIWDIENKVAVPIVGLEPYQTETLKTFCHTPKGGIFVVLVEKERSAKFIDINQRKIINTTPLHYAYNMVINNDSSFLAYSYGNGSVVMRKMSWLLSGIHETDIQIPLITVQPLPSSDNNEIVVYTQQQFSESRIDIVNSVGQNITNLHKGILLSGEHRFMLRTSEYPSGEYFVIFTHQHSSQSTPFIIRK